jgi:UPF0755 protein
MTRLSKISLFVVLAVVIVLAIGFNGVNKMFLRSPKENEPVTSFEVKEGDRLGLVAYNLEKEGFISSSFWFRVAARLSPDYSVVKPGFHDLKKGMSYADILRAISDDASTDISLTIPEGYTLKQIGALVTKNFEVTEEEWAKATGQFSPFESDPFVVAAKKPDGVDLEGYLFPDTYRFFTNADADDIVEKMLRAMETKVEALDAPTGDAKGMTMHEILTLASIIEREVRKPSEMKNVSDIFLKRLSIGMALQADSTVNYVTGGDDPSISLSDRDIESPYNTYQNPGLPPGPISNPGLNALTAVIHPAENDYLYFLTDDLGQVYYAKTFEEHIANKAKYLN